MTNSHDPLTVLNGNDQPVSPDPAFAARLRARLESALTLPERTQGVDMSGTETAIAELNEPSAATAPPRSAVVPYLTVPDARAAIAWYVDALGAVEIGEPIVMDDGRIGHAELELAGGVLYLADEYPEIGLKAPSPQANSVSLMLEVPDTDAALERARILGAQVQREPYENYGTRNAAIIDPSGHRWMLSGPATGATVQIQHGDVGYVSVWAPDAERAAAFYGHVLGWTYDPATGQVTNTRQPIGISGVAGAGTLFCCYAVTDLDGARRAIVSGGGEPGQTREFDFGTVLEATDPTGAPFAVFLPAGETPRPELNGSGPGELSYITYEVPDSTTFKQFYSRVLFWTFEPGRIDDGWGVQGSRPMSGMAGGAEQTTTVPMWTVADIDAAVSRVIEAGGTVLQQPSRQDYGVMAECTDDQGCRFYLGQF
ncbi:VOC family protein [Mycolicibacterium fortuitum]|uniref:Glyoxalase n=1 Tax=Mycolicibacterium fortuitum subsp. fortuitum DSM 46621 = ATCC 6841 = JCM 6387 TaxID=1214102 RepID=K0VFY9_MYCFO|nr:VOC family protein [Mycolicibacterium fortuitum]AIY45375.1 Glyoxalase family protein [Mycobacterium sp. VKM Ac-1817D]CRL80629.1 glyoxalase [Mycolicibacter nonchromogenicus]AMD54206.1 glyoxalase [Mycolicibacterium fortuitum subsp. fortuitum DSM 46621 = ATCC 6841 = JCM 6387]EJZ10034.1 glyoxalase [Mycolicibacterium fortuitum subsp. fortuitum DSM 46621 = ATCC 6841 = JCM 6387]WEV34162.1 VOC family protein [Mycolicibacterium fortuitum]